MKKEQLKAKLAEVNQQIQSLHDLGMQIVGQISLLEEQEKASAEEAKVKESK